MLQSNEFFFKNFIQDPSRQKILKNLKIFDLFSICFFFAYILKNGVKMFFWKFPPPPPGSTTPDFLASSHNCSIFKVISITYRYVYVEPRTRFFDEVARSSSVFYLHSNHIRKLRNFPRFFSRTCATVEKRAFNTEKR